MSDRPHVLYCHCAYAQVVPADVKDAVRRGLSEAGVAFEAVPDLCEMSARQDPALSRLVAAGPLQIAACYPRAVKWLFAAAGAPLPATGVSMLNMRALPASDIVSALLKPIAVPDAPPAGGLGGAIPGPAGNTRDGPPVVFEDSTVSSADPVAERAEAVRAELPACEPSGWRPWFPVIDYDRCTHCMQCLSFCLFGVYGVDAQHRIRVQHPTNCKNLCPACSRVCPEAAIMFPKYKAGPINGDEVSQADLEREKMKFDLSALLGGDAYALLRQRSERARSRFSKERDADQALRERQKCLTALRQLGDLPPEVLPLDKPFTPAEVESLAAFLGSLTDKARGQPK